MTESELSAIIEDELGNIAPEADLKALDRNADLREALDIDSMDFLNFITALHRRLGVDVPEIDYPKLATFEKALGYLKARLSVA
jgi:acyl carrier protein